MYLSSSRALIRAAISRSERALCMSAMLRALRLRAVWDLVIVKAELVVVEEDDESSEDEDAQARAHLAIACSTPAEIAPRRPPKTDELEDDEDDEMESTEASEAGLG